MKTRHDIEVLKAGWLRNPCWDVETTPGFEAHADELRAFRLATEARWKVAGDAREAAIDAEADQLGTHGLLRLVRRLEEVQRCHDATLAHLIEGRSDAAYRVLSGYAE